MTNLILVGLLGFFRMIDPMALELNDKAFVSSANAALPAGAQYKLRKVEMSSPFSYCYKIQESEDDGKTAKRTLSMGCLPQGVGIQVVTFDHDESVMDGGDKHVYVLTATRTEVAASYQVFMRGLIELVPQYPTGGAPGMPPVAVPAPAPAPPPAAATPPPAPAAPPEPAKATTTKTKKK